MKIKILVMVLTLMFVQLVYASDAPSSWQPELRIGVMFKLKNATVLPNFDCFFMAGNKKIKLKKGEVVALVLNKSHIEIKGQKFEGNLWEIRPDDPRKLKDLVFRINGKSYRGGLRLIRKGDVMTAINVIPAEEYLRGVVPEEMPPLWAK
ncbi:MAG: SpoIID/LytB domain-containing protein, partial [Selenomonadaceae bacterium]|nr:SpoIID/LytB domain-containing protein [Selenomonadaceae bacterium]